MNLKFIFILVSIICFPVFLSAQSLSEAEECKYAEQRINAAQKRTVKSLERVRIAHLRVKEELKKLNITFTQSEDTSNNVQEKKADQHMEAVVENCLYNSDLSIKLAEELTLIKEKYSPTPNRGPYLGPQIRRRTGELYAGYTLYDKEKPLCLRLLKKAEQAAFEAEQAAQLAEIKTMQVISKVDYHLMNHEE